MEEHLDSVEKYSSRVSTHYPFFYLQTETACVVVRVRVKVCEWCGKGRHHNGISSIGHQYKHKQIVGYP